MSRLSELWFRLTEKISTIIFSFIFFWGALVFLVETDDKIINYLDNLRSQIGYGYISAIKIMIAVASVIVGYILIVMPFSMIGMMILGNKVGDKKRFILRFF